MRKIFLTTAVAAGALALAACGTSGNSASSSSAAGRSTAGAPAAAANPAADLKTFGSPLGAIVVDGKGMTVYAFDKDTPGSTTSACTGTCASLWPAVTTTSATPSVQGVTGQVGTAPSAGGGEQVTLDGHRLYTFSGDSGSGQLNGQGYMHIWWVVSPAGTEITKAASSAAPSSSGGYSY